MVTPCSSCLLSSCDRCGRWLLALGVVWAVQIQRGELAAAAAGRSALLTSRRVDARPCHWRAALKRTVAGHERSRQSKLELEPVDHDHEPSKGTSTWSEEEEFAFVCWRRKLQAAIDQGRGNWCSKRVRPYEFANVACDTVWCARGLRWCVCDAMRCVQYLRRAAGV